MTAAAKSESGDSDKLIDAKDTWSTASDWVEDTEAPVKCIVCHEHLPGTNACIDHCIESHGLDLSLIKKRLGLEIYGSMRLVNYCRTLSLNATTAYVLDTADEWKCNDAYLKPVIPDDPLLYVFASESDEEGDSNAEEITIDDTKAKLKYALKELEELKLEFESDRAITDGILTKRSESKFNDDGNYYYESYSSNDIHETMLKDSARTEGYRDFIYDNKEYFKNKVVLDIGCGTGILSMFAAKAGAKHVYAVDNSSIIEKARLNAKENKLDDKITFLRGKIEDINLPVSKVDIILSEWMGYFLLYEGMLDSVICGRDKYLSDNGMMAPSQTTIQLAAYGDDEFYNDHLSFWNDVYGFKMSALKHSAVKNAYITTALPAEIISSIACIQLINTKAVTAEQLDFGSDFTLNITGGSKIYAFCGWFDTIFDGDGVKKNMFSTSPFTKKTHWMQTLFLLEEPLKVNAGDVIRGKIVVSKMFKNLREIQIDITYALQAGEEKFQTFYVT